MLYDAIVIGLGGVGSAALCHLARRGARVLGLDRFPGGHDRGSSHGQTRIIRLAYFEHPDYVPLLRRSFELWAELENEVQQQLYIQCGLLQVGPPEGLVLSGVRRSAARHGLAVETLTAQDIERRFPGFQAQANWQGLLEKRAGVLRVEECVLAHLNLAVSRGAEARFDIEVHGWQADGAGVVVQTDQDVLRTSRLVLTAGAWTSQLLHDLSIPLQVRRKPQYWYQPRDNQFDADVGCPAFLYELAGGIFYGLPQIDGRGVKVARHTGGPLVADPSQLDRDIDPADRSAVEGFIEQCLPRLSRDLLSHSVCMYTLTPDEHFIVDRHPRWPQIVLAAGLSGHGFKFTPVLGQALAELCLDGVSTLPIEFLRLHRPALRDPADA